MANLSSHGKAGPACLVELKHLKKSTGIGIVGKTALAKVMEQSYDYVGSSNIEWRISEVFEVVKGPIDWRVTG